MVSMLFFGVNGIGGVMVSMLTPLIPLTPKKSMLTITSLIPLTPKKSMLTITPLIPLTPKKSMLTTGWLRIRIMHPSEATHQRSYTIKIIVIVEFKIAQIFLF
jgi:hypothetical protein